MGVQPMTSDEDGELPRVPGGWTQVPVSTRHAAIQLLIPADPDAILDDAAVQEENRQDDYMPYWAWLWPAAREMAAIIADIPFRYPVDPCLETGCGVGLVGIAASLAGNNVVMSDYRSESVCLTRCNARLNGIRDPVVHRIDWRFPPVEKYRTIIACDVLYERRDHEPLIRFISSTMDKHGECWIGDPGRQTSFEFIDDARRTFRAKLLDRTMAPIPEPELSEFMLIHLTHPDESDT